MITVVIDHISWHEAQQEHTDNHNLNGGGCHYQSGFRLVMDHEATVPHRPGSAEPLAPVPEIASEATVPHRPAVHTRICPVEQQVPSLHAA